MERTEEVVQKLHTQMRLWEFPDVYVVEPTDGSSGPSLSVSRTDGSLSLIEEVPGFTTQQSPKKWTIFGVVGLLKLVVGSYLFVITGRESVGSLLGHLVFKVTSLKYFPCNLSLETSSAEQKNAEDKFLDLLNTALQPSGLYFSYYINLTLSLQRLHDLGDEARFLPLWRQAEPRFVWNGYLLEAFIDSKLDRYLLPIIQGSFQNVQEAFGREKIDLILIARRCTRRIGTRMWRRGSDSDGYAANFVETEQIVKMNEYAASFVQVRGSIPFLWEQIVDLSYKPKFEIVKSDEMPQVVERHFLDMRKKYGSVLAIDLVNKHGSEGRLSEKFSGAMQHVIDDDVRYLHFDFHHMCGHMHFEQLSLLLEHTSDFIDKTGYLLLDEKGEKMKAQTGVIRTNCIDCLDRTNVTQSMIGRRMLELQLRRIGLFRADETLDSHSELDKSFKILWANHGDEISIQYSGTPALKGDYVRFGKRTLQGILKDGFNALTRYYLNNFCDGSKQDAIDLLQGHYIVSITGDITAPCRSNGLDAVASFPLALSLTLTGLVFAMMSLKHAGYDLWQMLASFTWGSLSVGIFTFLKSYGRAFCNKPRLHQHLR